MKVISMVFSYASTNFRLDPERRFCCEIWVEIGVFEFPPLTRRDRVGIQKGLNFNVLFFRACSVVSGSVPPNFKSKFAVDYEIRPSDGLSIFRLAQLVQHYQCPPILASCRRLIASSLLTIVLVANSESHHPPYSGESETRKHT